MSVAPGLPYHIATAVTDGVSNKAALEAINLGDTAIELTFLDCGVQMAVQKRVII